MLVVAEPPQEQKRITVNGANSQATRRTLGLFWACFMRIVSATSPATQIQGGANSSNMCKKAKLRGVVVTLTLKVLAVVGFTVTVEGTEQVVPAGAPVQLK